MNKIKRCTKCGTDQDISEFVKNDRYKDGYAGHCRLCRNKYVREHNAGKGRTKWLVRKRKFNIELYGITVEKYEQLLIQQNFSCAICKEIGYSQEEWDRFISGEEKTELDRNKLYIDHCHDTGAVRGLLCNDCNTSIGKLKHDPELLQAGIDYLKRKGLITV